MYATAATSFRFSYMEKNKLYPRKMGNHKFNTMKN